MINNICNQFNLGNPNDYYFFLEEYIINDDDDLVFDKFNYKDLELNIKKKINIDEKNMKKKKNEDLIILNQGINGLWKINIENLSWFNFDFKKWKVFLNNNKDKIKNIFKVDISEEVIFNLIVLDYIMKIAKGKTRFNLIIKKTIKEIKKKYKEIDDNKINKFRNDIIV